MVLLINRGTYYVMALMAFLSLSAYSLAELELKQPKTERDYQEAWCAGDMEVVLKDKTRVDCLVYQYAVEIDWAHKWAECIGQSLHYARMTNRTPGCLLIISKPSDCKHIQKVELLGIRTWTTGNYKLCGILGENHYE